MEQLISGTLPEWCRGYGYGSGFVGNAEKYGALRREVIGEALRSTSRSGACILKEDL